jgi:hypothetical protein
LPPKAVTASRRVANSSPRLSVGFGGNEKSQNATFSFSDYIFKRDPQNKILAANSLLYVRTPSRKIVMFPLADYYIRVGFSAG